MTQQDQPTTQQNQEQTTPDFAAWAVRVTLLYMYAQTWQQIASQEEAKMRKAIFNHMNSKKE